VLGSIPGFREPSEDLGGLRVIDIYVPIVIAFVLAMLALSLVPTALATYRERGVLRRLATTPLPPARLLLAQMVTGVTTALLTVILVIAVGALVFGVAMPKQAGGFLLALVLGSASVFAIGLVLAAVAPTGRAASGLGSMLFFPMLFFAGLYVTHVGSCPTSCGVSATSPHLALLCSHCRTPRTGPRRRRCTWRSWRG
jgi:ABC-2 type transport system permease protein